ncbi:MAG TPA: F0F1 ATP synthase subunit delta [Acidimicrobiales bacterium]|nr:F0F1 ATP synthase subunit delta [Acidimicrobiales bacterium]
MNPSLMGYEAAVLGGLDATARRQVAGELAALEVAVSSDPALRAALTDTSIAPGPRRAVVADLLDAKLSVPAVRIAAYAAFSAPAQDVPASIAEAALRARAVADDADLDEPALSVGASRRRVGGYAAAVFEDETVATLDGVEDDLFHWARAIEASAPLRNALTNRDLPADERTRLVTDLLSGRASPVTVRLAVYAVEGGRPRDLLGTLDWLVDAVAEERGWRVARVTSARAIDDATRERLADTLRSLVGRPVELEVALRADLLGGVLVEVGDLRVDATARGRLDAFREHLTAEPGATRTFDTTTATQGAS